MRRSGNPAHRGVQPTGIKIDASARHQNEMRDPGPGRHLWTVLGVWQVVDPERGPIMLDTENLLTIEGPGCFKCEAHYGAALAAQPCPGSMD